MNLIVDALNYAFSKSGDAITLDEALRVVKDAIRVLERAGKKNFLFVFDGYNENYAGAKHMLWVGSGKKADDWIINFVSKNKGNIILITRDKALVDRVKWINKNVVIWDPAEFDDYLNKLSKRENTKVKYTKEEPDTTAENLRMLKDFDEREFERGFESYVKTVKAEGKKTDKSKEGDIISFENVDWEEISSKFEEELQKLRK